MAQGKISSSQPILNRGLLDPLLETFHHRPPSTFQYWQWVPVGGAGRQGLIHGSGYLVAFWSTDDAMHSPLALLLTVEVQQGFGGDRCGGQH